MWCSEKRTNLTSDRCSEGLHAFIFFFKNITLIACGSLASINLWEEEATTSAHQHLVENEINDTITSRGGL